MDDFDRASNKSSDDSDDNVDEHAKDHMDVDGNHQEDDDDNDNDNDDDDNDNEGDDDDDNDDDKDGDDDDEDDDKDQKQQSQPENPTVTRTSATPSRHPTPSWQPLVAPQLLNASSYDIIPTMAAPMATSINTIAITPDLRYWMTGGSDGYIRKYHGPDTINGKTLLTVLQRHPFVDSVTKAGVLMSYWENAEPQGPNARVEDQVLSPVYSLAVNSQALWLLSGLESGGINLQSVRHDEGKRITCLQKHTNAVSVLQLAADEMSVLSGSWDRNIYNWDLNVGTVTRSFDGNTSQLSALEVRPMSGAPFPAEASELELPSDTMFSNNDAPLNGDTTFKSEELFPNGVDGGSNDFDMNGMGDLSADGAMDTQGSPGHDSLFGGSPGAGDDLFGDNDGMGGFDGDDDNEFSRAMMQDSAQDPSNGPIGDFDVSAPAFDPAPDAQPPQEENDPLKSNTALDSVSKTDDTMTDHTLIDNNMTVVDDHGEGPSLTDFNFEIEGDPTFTSQPANDSQAAANPPSSQPAQAGAPASPSTVFAAPAPTHADLSQTSDSTFLSACIDGVIRVWDRRVQNPIARIGNRPGVPPWCMGACWSTDGNWIYAGRRNGTVEEFSVQQAKGGYNGWQPTRVFKFPGGSGPVSTLRPMVNGRHLVCASNDILRLYDLHANVSKRSPPPFTIVPGPPRAGVISTLYVDRSSRFMISASGNRGWEGSNTEVLIGYEISPVNK